jgi:hypothetical protein
VKRKNVLTYSGLMLDSGSVNESEILEMKAQLDAEYRRQKAQLYAEYKQASEGLEAILSMLRRKRNGASPSLTSGLGSTPEPQPHPEPDNHTGRPKKARGILASTRAILDQLPDPFTTPQLGAMLEETYPEQFAGKINRDSLRGTLKQLSDEGWIKQIAEGAGPRPALYKHLKMTVEKVM